MGLAAILALGLAVQSWYFRPLAIGIFFERAFLQFLLEDPEAVSSLGVFEQLGYKGFDGMLTDVSPAHEQKLAQMARDDLATLHGYDRSSLSPSHQLSYDVLEWFLQDLVDGRRWLFYDYPVNQLFGVQSSTADFMVQIHPIGDQRDVRNYISRLTAFDRKFEQLLQGLRLRESMGIDERSGTATNLSDSQYELGGYLERAGYLDDALAAFHQYRQLSDELRQQDRQRALIELQESFANESRQHELDMLSREGKLKDEEIRHHELQIKQWTAAGIACVLLLALLAVLARRLRVRNQMLSVSNEQLRIQAEIDPLTGLSNRHHLQAVMAERGTRGLEGTLYLLDVDHFKQINDQCGHAGGDTVLVEIARRLRHTLRDDDLIVRWGGEEFLVLVRPLPQAEAEALAQRLLCALADAPVMHEGKPVPVSASIGFGLFPMRTSTPQSDLAINWERAISLVDTAMYMAKAHGRNGACSIQRIDAASTAEVEEVIAQLEKSVREGRVELRFQQGPAVRGALTTIARAPEGLRTPAHGAEVS